jgi:soluble lytic murein transglycosylase
VRSLGWLVLGALAACSAQRAPVGSHGLPTPIGVDSGANTAAKDADASAGEVSIEQFQPLLAEPALAKAQKLYEAGSFGAAAREVEAQMAKAQPSGREVPRWQMLLGRLREQAGNLTGAIASYELAAAETWPLSGYATLGVGRVSLRAGKVDQAIRWLERVPSGLPYSIDARLLLAEAAVRAGKPDLAIDTWRAHLAEKPADATDVSLRLASALLDRATGSSDADAKLADAREALSLARRVEAQNAGTISIVDRARKLRDRALDALPKAERAQLAKPTAEDDLERLRALVDARLEAEAENVADALLASLPKKDRWGDIGCEAALLRGKAIALKRKAARAAEAFDDVAKHCGGNEDVLAKALYLSAKYTAADGRHMQAIQRWAELEKRLPKHRLADDARMHAALSYFELGIEARFTELLSSMPDDYPDGDVVLDAVFRLALRRIEKDDWKGAESVLDRVARAVEKNDSARGTEFSGRERYFRARAWIENGDDKRGYDELEAIVKELPLSYYMLHAYSRLLEKDPFRAKKAIDQAEKRAAAQPFSFDRQPEFDSADFQRAMELLRQGELDLARREIESMGIAKPGATPQLLWGIALLWSRAGSAKDAHQIARGMLTDWLGRWPAGDWAKAWQLAFPRPYHPIVQRECKKNEVPEALVYGVMREESAFDPSAASHADAFGLMQLIVPTAKLLAKPVGLPWDASSLKRPAINIALGSRGLADLEKSFAQNPLLAIPAYNAGPNRPRRWARERPHADFDVWVEEIPITETRRYTKRVLASRAAYAYLYDNEHAAEAMALPLRVD